MTIFVSASDYMSIQNPEEAKFSIADREYSMWCKNGMREKIVKISKDLTKSINLLKTKHSDLDNLGLFAIASIELIYEMQSQNEKLKESNNISQNNLFNSPSLGSGGTREDDRNNSDNDKYNIGDFIEILQTIKDKLDS